MERRTARLALYAGLVLTVLGLIVLYIGYNGAATHANQVQQIPYLVSGGFTGLVLVILGAAAMIAAVIILHESSLREGMAILNDSIQEMTEALSHRAFGAPDETTPMNGQALVSVTRGASSFHRSECRLVAGKRTVKTLPRDEAERTGLLACRVCKP